MVRNLIFILLLCTVHLSAQEELTVSPYYEYYDSEIEHKPFDHDQWAKAKEGIDYSDISVRQPPVEKSDSVEQKKEIPAKKKSKRRNRKVSSPFLNSLFNILLIVGGIAILGLIISQFLGGGGLKFRRNKNIEGEVINYDVAQVEEKLIESDLDRMIRIAEEAGDFQLALRLQYLAGIKTLATNEHIKWKKAKTNRTYINEINNTKIKTQLEHNTLIYERIWFGDSLLTQDAYTRLKPVFKDFNNQVAIVSARYANRNDSKS